MADKLRALLPGEKEKQRKKELATQVQKNLAISSVLLSRAGVDSSASIAGKAKQLMRLAWVSVVPVA